MQGEYLESWSAPFEPEAIYVRADGTIFVAGEGQLARLSPKGEVELQQKSPHADAMSQNLDKIREDVIAQNKRQAEMYTQQAKQYDQMLKRADKQIEEVKEQIAKLDQAAKEDGEAERMRPIVTTQQVGSTKAGARAATGDARADEDAVRADQDAMGRDARSEQAARN